MDNAPDSGPEKKPTPRTNSRPTGTRKPPPVRKPTARRPAAKTPVAPAAPPVDEAPVEQAEAVVEELEFEDATVLSPRDAELRERAAEVEEPPAAVEEPEAVAEVEAVVEPEPEPEPAAEAEPEPEPEAELVAEPEAEAEPSDESGREAEPATEPAAVTASSPGFAASVAAWGRRVTAASGARIAAAREARAARTAAAEPGAETAVAEVALVEAAPVETAPAKATKPRGRQKSGKELFPSVSGGAKGSTTVLSVRGLTKSFDGKLAVDSVDLEVKVGAFYGIVGPNGAGKTTTLSMITGLLRPDSGTVVVNGSDVWTDTVQAKRMMGVLPDRLRLFDRLTGGQLLYYAGVLRGLDNTVVRERTADLAHAFGLEESLGRLVSDYSAGMTKKIALAAAMIHSPRLLVLDEPFESVDPVSAATVTQILKKYVSAGGTVVLSSHSMDLVQRICDHVAVVVRGELLADGTMAEVRNGQTLEERFVELAGGRTTVEGLEWLHSFSD